MTGNGDTELAMLSAELVALTMRDHSALAAEIRTASEKMHRLSRPRNRWFSVLLGATGTAENEARIKDIDHDLDQIATRISHLGEAARGRAIVLRRLSDKAAKVDTNTYIAGMNATFINAAAAKAAVTEDIAADAANRFLTQALPLWRTTRAQGNSQMRQAAGAIEAALDALGTSIERKHAAAPPNPSPGSA